MTDYSQKQVANAKYFAGCMRRNEADRLSKLEQAEIAEMLEYFAELIDPANNDGE